MSSNKRDLFGSMYDFNGDGKSDIFETTLAFMMFEKIMKDENDEIKPSNRLLNIDDVSLDDDFTDLDDMDIDGI